MRIDRTANFDHARAVAVAVAGRVVRAGGGDAVAGEAFGDGEEAAARRCTRRRCAATIGRGDRVDLKAVEPLAVRRLPRVRVRPGVGQLVAVGRTTAEEPTLVLACAAMADRTRILIRFRSPFDMPP